MICTPIITNNGGVADKCFIFSSGVTVSSTLCLLVMAAGVVVGSVRENSFVVVGLTAFGTVVKGWNDFKKFP